MGRLDGKVAVITGAGSGIARSAASIFTREGACVVVAEIDEGKGAITAREAGNNAVLKYFTFDKQNQEVHAYSYDTAKGAKVMAPSRELSRPRAPKVKL